MSELGVIAVPGFREALAAIGEQLLAAMEELDPEADVARFTVTAVMSNGSTHMAVVEPIGEVAG